MTSRPTLRDVATRAGVATTTVARVLNNSGYVADDTRLRVEEAVKSTGYRVNSLARTLRANRSYIIGHLLSSTLPNPFFLRVARGVEEHARTRGYTALTYNVQIDAAAERKGIDTFLSWRADGLIFTTPVEAANVEYTASRGVPLVQVERPRTEGTNRITVRNYAGALEAMRHLIDLGHRRIAYVGQQPQGTEGQVWLASYVERERTGAYHDAMAAVGAATDGLVHFGHSYLVDKTTAQGHGYDATMRLLARDPRPTAIFTSSDLLAAGALQAIHEVGLRVPEEISVVGCDDTLAGYMSPLLSTVRLPARRLGDAAARLVIDTIEGEGPQSPAALELEAEFVLRRSTGAASA